MPKTVTDTASLKGKSDHSTDSQTKPRSLETMEVTKTSEEPLSTKAFEPQEECIENMDMLHDKKPDPPPPHDARQFVKLLAMEKVEQRTEAWYALRKSMITASDWASAIGEGVDGRIKVVRKKCGVASPFNGNVYTEWGVKYEPVATRLYELREKTVVHEFGVLRHPTNAFLGASPDGITPLGVMLEIKCPFKRKIGGPPPRYYWIQVQGQLEVCDLEYCDFLECKIIEYSGLDEYLADVEEDPPKREYNVPPLLQKKYQEGRVFNRDRFGMEKGVVITYVTPKGKKEYVYSELGVSKEEFEDWYKNHRKDINPTWTETKVTFWRFNKICCVRIKRDRQWFKEALPKLTETWREIEHYRKVGAESIRKKKKSKNIDYYEEPSEEDYNALLHGENKFQSFSSDIISGDLSMDHVPPVTPICDESIDVSNLPEPSPSNLSEILGIIEKVKDEKDAEPVRPPVSTLDLETREAIFDLELATYFLPKYFPLDAEVLDERAVDDTMIKMAGLHKMVARTKTALVRLNRLTCDELKLTYYPLRNQAHSIDVWMNGLPQLIKDYLKDTKVKFPADMVKALEDTIFIATKWNESVYPKWKKKWDRA